MNPILLLIGLWFASLFTFIIIIASICAIAGTETSSEEGSAIWTLSIILASATTLITGGIIL